MSGSCSSGRRAGKLSDPFHVGDSAPSRSDRMSLTAVERVLVTNPLTAAIFVSFDGRGDAYYRKATGRRRPKCGGALGRTVNLPIFSWRTARLLKRGQTASGHSAVGLRLAGRLPGSSRPNHDVGVRANPCPRLGGRQAFRSCGPCEPDPVDDLVRGSRCRVRVRAPAESSPGSP